MTTDIVWQGSVFTGHLQVRLELYKKTRLWSRNEEKMAQSFCKRNKEIILQFMYTFLSVGHKTCLTSQETILIQPKNKEKEMGRNER